MSTPLAAPRLEPVRQSETWLTIERVAQLESWTDGRGEISRREIQRRVRAGEYRTRDSGARTANHRLIFLIALSSLSPRGQERWLAQLQDRVEGRAILPLAEPPSPEPRRGADVPLTPEGEPEVAALRATGRDAEADLYERRKAAVLRAIAALERAPHGRKAEAWKTLQLELDVPSQTLRTWVRRYQRGGAAALLPHYGAGRGLYRSLPGGLQAAVLAAHRNQQRQTIAQIMRHTVRPWCAAHGHVAPNRTTVGRFLECEILASERVAFRVGRGEWQAQIAAKVERNPADLAVNDLWCADHRRLDVFVFAPDGRMVRPWVTLYVDIASAGFVGWCLRDRPNSQSVALALRAGILKRGVPRALYHDNGKEFTANRFGGKAARLTRLQIQNPTDSSFHDCPRWPALLAPVMDGVYGRVLLLELGIERVIHALPYSAWSKPIESMFHAFHRAWENMMPGWCGNSTEGRPEKLKAEMRDGRLLAWDQFVEIFTAQVSDWNANHVCGSRAKTPDQFYEAAREELRFVSDQALDLLLLQAEDRKVPAQGVEVGGKRFLDENLALFVGEYVSVAWDPDDLSAVIVRPKRNPNQRLIVAPIPHAGWFDYSQANLIAKRVQRLQRAQIRLVATSDREALVPDYVDPTGANRLAVMNAATRRAAEQNPRANALVAELKAAQAEERDRAVAEIAESRRAHAAVAARIAAQAQEEQSYRKGEEPHAG